MIGFCGSRSLPPAYSRVVSAVVGAFAPGPFAVGDAAGADALVRAACPSALVFRAGGPGPSALVARSCALVAALAASPSPALIGFVQIGCPAGIVPAARWLPGRPTSGSWSSLALAAGLRVPVGVVFCAPLLAPPAAWGDWSREMLAGVPVWWFALPAQLSMFSGG